MFKWREGGREGGREEGREGGREGRREKRCAKGGTMHMYVKGGTKGERFKGRNDGRIMGQRRQKKGGRATRTPVEVHGYTCSYPMPHKLHPPLPSTLTCSCFFTSSQYFMASASLFLSSSYSLSACREGRGCCPNSDSVRPIPTEVGHHLPLINCPISDYSITAHRLRCLLLSEV